MSKARRGSVVSRTFGVGFILAGLALVIALGSSIDLPDSTTSVRLLVGTSLLFVLFAGLGIWLLQLPKPATGVALGWLLWIPGAALLIAGGSPLLDWHPWINQRSDRAGGKVTTYSHSAVVAQGVVLIALGVLFLAAWAVPVVRTLRKSGRRRVPRRILRATSAIALVVLIALVASESVSLKLAAREPAGLRTYGPTAALQPGSGSMTRTAANAELDRYYGRFTPYTRSGSADATISLPPRVIGALLTVRYTGSGPFDLETFDATGQQVYADDLPITAGPYSGTVMIGSKLGTGAQDYPLATRVHVDATGPWTISVSPVSSATRLPAATVSGGSDAVYLQLGPARKLSVAYRTTGSQSPSLTVAPAGTANGFPVIATTSPYSGSMELPVGPLLVVVQADGRWSLSP